MSFLYWSAKSHSAKCHFFVNLLNGILPSVILANLVLLIGTLQSVLIVDLLYGILPSVILEIVLLLSVIVLYCHGATLPGPSGPSGSGSGVKIFFYIFGKCHSDRCCSAEFYSPKSQFLASVILLNIILSSVILILIC